MRRSTILTLCSSIPLLFALVAAAFGQDRLTKKTHVYKSVDGLDILADVYLHDPDGTRDDRPNAAKALRPVVVWIHGGALINGHRENVPAWLREAASDAGYVLVSIDYRLAPETKLPEIIADVEDAFRWIRQSGPRLFQADGARIAVIGGSAGGYLTLVTGHRVQPPPVALVSLWGYGDLIGAWYSQPSTHARHNQSKISRDEAMAQVAGPRVSDARKRRGDGGMFYQYCRQQGIWPNQVAAWDAHAEPEKFFPFMPLKNVTRDYPPTLLIHGQADTDVPYDQSVMMAAELTRNGVDHQLISLPSAEHGLAGGNPKDVDEAYRAAVEFLEKHLARSR